MVTRRRFCGSMLGAALLTGCAGRGLAPAEGWRRIPDGPLSPRHLVAGGWLAGRFVLAGGWSSRPCPDGASCAMPEEPALRDGAAFDPAGGTWSSLPDAPTPIGDPTRSVVVGRRWYVLTMDLGLPDSPDAFLCYDADRNRWSTLPVPPRMDVTLIGTDAAGILAIGGSDEQGVTEDFRFDPDRARWTRLAEDPLGPRFDREGAWLGDRLLLAARELVASPGAERPSLARLALWDPIADRWTKGADTEVIGWRPTWVGERVVWPKIGGGDGGQTGNWGRHYSYGGILDPRIDQWTALPSPPAGPGLGDDVVLTIGTRVTVGGHLLDPVRLDWINVPESPIIDRNGSAVVAGDSTILVWGGADDWDNFADGHLLRVS